MEFTIDSGGGPGQPGQPGQGGWTTTSSTTYTTVQGVAPGQGGWNVQGGQPGQGQGQGGGWNVQGGPQQQGGGGWTVVGGGQSIPAGEGGWNVAGQPGGGGGGWNVQGGQPGGMMVGHQAGMTVIGHQVRGSGVGGAVVDSGGALSCFNCSLNLTGHRYILRDEKPFCIKCYEKLFANHCEECKAPIGTDFKDLSYKDKHWHETCFRCFDCKSSLVDRSFAHKNDKTYCPDCHDNNFAIRCDGCNNIFRAGMKKYEFKGKQYHEQCFSCKVCRQPIGTKTFIPRDQEVVCVPCYEEQYAQRCVKCNGVINKGGITYKNSPWHRDCFTCYGCSRILTGEKFTSREEKPFCETCFAQFFAKKCCRCTRPITGLGSTKFISFDERHWHTDCFSCYKCNGSLVGRGFLVAGPDVLCPECGRA